MCATRYLEVIIPPPNAIYHQFHYTKEWEEDAKKRPDADNIEVLVNITRMMETREPLILNDEGWGYAREELEEVWLVLEGVVIVQGYVGLCGGENEYKGEL